MAAILNDKDNLLAGATPRVITVSVPNINVTGQIGGVAVGTVISNASTGATHASSTGNVHNVDLAQISGDLDDINNGVTYFRTNANQVAGAGRGFNALNSSSDYIRSLNSTQLTVVGSNPSTGWVGDFNGIRMYQAGTLKVNIPVSGSPSFSGDITGGSNLDITGVAKFGGSSSFNSYSAAVHANTSLTANVGLAAYCKGGLSDTGLFALDAGSGTAAWVYNSSTGTGGTALLVQRNNSGGTALSVVGRMSINNTNLISNLNADMVDGKHASALCSIVVPNIGSCTVSGNGFNLVSTVGGVRTNGNGSNGIIIESFSDLRLKSNLEPEKLGIDFINKLIPYTYEVNHAPGLRHHGFIHQDVKPLLSENDGLTPINSDGMGGFDYNGIAGPIVKAIQELYNMHIALKKEIQNG